MVDTRSRLVEGEAGEGSQPMAAPQKQVPGDTPATAAAATVAPTTPRSGGRFRLRRGGAAGTGVAGAQGLSDSQAYTLLALALGTLALPLLLTPKLVRGAARSWLPGGLSCLPA